MKKFSLLVPTRERPNQLIAYLNSVQLHTQDLNRIEILIAYDKDDKLTDERFKGGLINNYPFKIKSMIRARSEFINRDYYNWLGEMSEGDYLFINADDILFIIPQWDRIIETKIEMFCNDKPDRIVGIGIKDNTPKPKPELPQFPCFPLVTREAFKHFGYILHPFIPTWGADYLFYLLYTGGSRYLSIDDKIYMQHIGIHTHTGPKDKTAENVEKVFNQLKGNPAHSVDVHKVSTIPKQIAEFRAFLRKWTP